MGPPDAQGPPPAPPPSSELQLALEQAVQYLVDRTGRPAHDLATTLEALLRQGRFGAPDNNPPRHPSIDRSFDQNVKDKERTNDRAHPCGQAVDTPQDAQDPLRWAEDAAQKLNDPDSVLCYRSFARRYPRDLLERALADALAVPDAKIRRSRAALFVALVGVRARSAKKRSGS